jgi:hypothetical protein
MTAGTAQYTLSQYLLSHCCFRGGRFGNRWQTSPEDDVEESNVDDTQCVLDHFNSDLNLVVDPDG